MTSHGLCWQCGQVVARYDVEQRRWACRSCWPKRLPGDYRLHDQALNPAPSAPALPVVRDEPPRLPGESRQAHRRRAREAQQQ